MVRGERPFRWGGSEVTLSVCARIIWSLVALIPVWLVGRAVVKFLANDWDDGVYVDVPLAFTGMALLPLTFWCLRDLWRVNPVRRRIDRETSREAARIADDFAAERRGLRGPLRLTRDARSRARAGREPRPGPPHPPGRS